MKSSQLHIQHYDKEISLIGLMKIFWMYKTIIIPITLIGFGFGLFYSYLSMPVYSTKVHILPSRSSDIGTLNVSNFSQSPAFTKYSNFDLYGIFIKNLTSESFRRSFFEHVYYPLSIDKEKSSSKDSLYEEFKRKLKIKLVDKANLDYEISIDTNGSKNAKDYILRLLEMATIVSLNELNEDIEYQLNIVLTTLKAQIEQIKKVDLASRLDRIEYLRDALDVAQKAKIIKILRPYKLKSYNDLFMLGTNVLNAMIINLEKQTVSPDALIKLRELTAEYNYYSDFKIDKNKIIFFKYDGSINTLSISPKKSFFLLLGLVVGIIVGMIFAFILHSIKTVHYTETES